MTQNVGKPVYQGQQARPSPGGQPIAAPNSYANSPQNHSPQPLQQRPQHVSPPPAASAQHHQSVPQQQPGAERRLIPRGAPLARAVNVEGPAQGSLPERLISGFKSSADKSGETAKQNKFLLFAALGFLFFFILLAGSTVLKSRHADKAAGLEQSKSEISAQGMAISDRIGSAVRWQDTALSFRGSASQIVGVAARGDNVMGVALLDSNGRSLSHYPTTAKTLNKVSLKDFPKSGVRIDSLPGENGQATPIIVRRSGNNYLVTQFTQGSLVRANGEFSTAIVSRSGQVIDATGNIRTGTLAETFSMSDNQLRQITTIEQGVGTRATPDGSVMAAVRIENTDLTLIRDVGVPSIGISDNLLTFLLLLGGTSLLITALLRRAYGQVADAQQEQRSSDLSQLRFQKAVQGGRGGIFEINLHENAVFVNRSLARFLGLNDEDQDMTMSQFLGLVETEDREKLLASVRRSMIQGSIEIDVRAAHRAVILKLRGDTLQSDSDSGSTILSGVGSDITEQRGAQNRLQLAEARLYDALNSMTNSFVVWDRMHRLLLWNGKFEDFFGFAPGQLQVGQEQHLVEHYAHQKIQDIFQANDSETDDDIELLLSDGRWVRYVETPTADGGVVSIGTDITEIREREQQLRSNDGALRNTVDVLRKSQARILELADSYEQEKIRAEEASQSKSDFLANMSHELRTPLNAINGFSDIMKKEMFGPLGDPRYKEYISDILFSGQHLLSLINDILDMSKIEAGKMTLNTDMLRVGDMVTQVLRIVRGRAEDSKLKLLYENVGTKSVEADPRAVKQVLLNLITNAIKFTPEGGTVRVEVIEKQAGVIVKIIDSGIGISQEDIERLAKPFEQVDKEASKQTEGTGLGLALSKSLVELHGGNFKMESEPGQGTTVTFTLPNTPPAREEPQNDEEVGDEISRLAQDIADVLAGSETAEQPRPVPVSLSAIDDHTSPQPQSAPAPAPVAAAPPLPPMPPAA